MHEGIDAGYLHCLRPDGEPISALQSPRNNTKALLLFISRSGAHRKYNSKVKVNARTQASARLLQNNGLGSTLLLFLCCTCRNSSTFNPLAHTSCCACKRHLSFNFHQQRNCNLKLIMASALQLHSAPAVRQPTGNEIARFIATRTLGEMLELMQNITSPAAHATITAALIRTQPRAEPVVVHEKKKALNAFVGFRCEYHRHCCLRPH